LNYFLNIEVRRDYIVVFLFTYICKKMRQIGSCYGILVSKAGALSTFRDLRKILDVKCRLHRGRRTAETVRRYGHETADQFPDGNSALGDLIGGNSMDPPEHVFSVMELAPG
jgi:hypothetical protein